MSIEIYLKAKKILGDNYDLFIDRMNKLGKSEEIFNDVLDLVGSGELKKAEQHIIELIEISQDQYNFVSRLSDDDCKFLMNLGKNEVLSSLYSHEICLEEFLGEMKNG